MLSCVIAVALDPLFFYIPVIDDKDKCLDSDETLTIIACVLRSLFDVFYILHISLQFQAAFIAHSSRIFGRGVLINDPVAIAKRFLSTYFLIDILSILPLPQVCMWQLIGMKYHYSGLLQELYVLSAIITTFSLAPTVVIGSHFHWKKLAPQLVTSPSM